jgi:hypothetical protein
LLWYGTQKFTNPQLDAHAVAKLRAKSGLDARVVSDVNKQRGEFRETREEVERRVRWEDHGG